MPNSEQIVTTDTQLFRLIDKRDSVKRANSNSKCAEHGEKIVKLETEYENMEEKIDQVLLNQDKMAEDQDAIKTELAEQRGEKRFFTSIIGGGSGIIGAVFGSIVTYFTKG